MITYAEAAAGLTGAWRLARLDPSGLAYFDASERGFWRSFWAAAIYAPGYVIIVALDYAQHPPAASDMRILAVQLIAYVISWTAYPLAMFWGTAALGREAHYTRFIVAWNWANVLEMAVFLPVAGLAAATGEQIGILPLIASLLILAYQWYVARTVLVISRLRAVAVVALDLVIDMMLLSVVQAMVPSAAS
jgi:hypothetical protein